MTQKKQIELSNDLLASAKAHFERLPQSPEEVIEHWARLGQKLSEELTELEEMNFLLGNLDITIKKQ